MEVSCQSRLVGPFCVSFYFRIPMFALSLLSVFLLCLALFKWDWSSPWGGLVNLCHRCTLCNFFRTTSVKVIDNITCFCLSTPTWESRTINFTFCFASFTLVSLVRSFSSLSSLVFLISSSALSLYSQRWDFSAYWLFVHSANALSFCLSHKQLFSITQLSIKLRFLHLLFSMSVFFLHWSSFPLFNSILLHFSQYKAKHLCKFVVQ